MSLYPIFRSPFTDLTGCMFDRQATSESLCAKIEMRLNDCVEAYGIDKSNIKCRDLFDDFVECGFRRKEQERVRQMRLERHRQYYLTGERKEHYAPPPRIDAL